MGMDPTFSFYLVSIANASSGVGRYVSGALADQVGPLNVMIPFTFVSAIMTCAWPFARTKVVLIVVAVLYGFCSGSYVSLLGNPIMNLGETGDVGRRLGMLMSTLAVGAMAGPPISGAISSSAGGFPAVGRFAALTVIVGVFLMCGVRQLVLKRAIGKF